MFVFLTLKRLPPEAFNNGTSNIRRICSINPNLVHSQKAVLFSNRRIWSINPNLVHTKISFLLNIVPHLVDKITRFLLNEVPHLVDKITGSPQENSTWSRWPSRLCTWSRRPSRSLFKFFLIAVTDWVELFRITTNRDTDAGTFMYD